MLLRDFHVSRLFPHYFSQMIHRPLKLIHFYNIIWISSLTISCFACDSFIYSTWFVYLGWFSRICHVFACLSLNTDWSQVGVTCWNAPSRVFFLLFFFVHTWSHITHIIMNMLGKPIIPQDFSTNRAVTAFITALQIRESTPGVSKSRLFFEWIIFSTVQIWDSL